MALDRLTIITSSGLSSVSDYNVDGLRAVGVVTATGFDGPLTGDATGLTGTPNVTVGSITAASANFSGNVSIAGTLTYEDVTSVDSVGLSTFQAGINVTGGVTVGTGATLDGSTNVITASTNGSERFRVHSNGKVGIGTAVPTELFTVYSPINGVTASIEANTARAYDSATLKFLGGNLSTNTLQFGDATVADVGKIVYNHDGNSLAFTVNSSEALRIASNGFIGIGTNNPAEDVHIQRERADVLIEGTNDTVSGNVANLSLMAPFYRKVGYSIKDSDGNEDFFIGRPYGQGDSNPDLVINMTGNEKVRIRNNGRVGIGSDNPGQALSIAGDSVSLGIYNSGNNHGNVYFYKDGTPKGWLKYRGDNERVIIGNVTDAIQIDSSGQVFVSSPVTLNYQGTATPYNNNNLTLLGANNIGLIGSHSTINWPSDSSNAVTTEPWYMMGRPHGTTDRWSFAIRPGSSNNRYNIIDCYNNSSGTIESLRFGTNAGNEALRIDISGCIRVGNTHSQTTSSNTKRIALGAKASIWGWTSGNIDGALTLADNYYWDGANNRAIEAADAAYLTLRNGSLRFGTTDSTPSAGGVTGLTEKFQIDDLGSIIQKTSSAVDNTEGSNSANSNYHARGASFNKIVSVNNNSPVSGQCMNMLSHTRYLTLNGSTNYDMITIGNREGCFIGHIYAGYSTGSDGAVAMYKFHTFYGGASTLTAEISPQSRSSDTISVSMVQGANGDQHTIRVSGNGYTGEVTIGVVFLSASRTGDNHFTVRYY